ncbi:hypothetical protein LCGC14_1052890 [marine sediment metagenome]|uniref:Uncharacterized protein n=1 Tax=marine sediment metagenome TaxID=412755 RepID=A0A0F9MNB9_9ZZZZ
MSDRSTTHCRCGKPWTVSKTVETDYGRPVSGYWCGLCDTIEQEDGSRSKPN